jgi:hypothetical protein
MGTTPLQILQDVLGVLLDTNVRTKIETFSKSYWYSFLLNKVWMFKAKDAALVDSNSRCHYKLSNTGIIICLKHSHIRLQLCDNELYSSGLTNLRAHDHICQS